MKNEFGFRMRWGLRPMGMMSFAKSGFVFGNFPTRWDMVIVVLRAGCLVTPTVSALASVPRAVSLPGRFERDGVFSNL